MTLRRLARVNLVVVALGTLAFMAAAVAILRTDTAAHRELTRIIDIDRRSDAFSVGVDAAMLHGADAGMRTALIGQGRALQAELRTLAEAHPDAGNAARAVGMMIDVLEAARDGAAIRPARSDGRRALAAAVASHGIVLDSNMAKALRASQGQITDRLHRTTLMLIGLSMVFLATSTVALFVTHRRIGAPLARFADTVAEIGRGNLGVRAPAGGRGEIARLGSAINRMAERRQRAEDAAERQAALLRMAGATARFGGWRYAAGADHADWTEETARIHDEPPGTAPDLDRAISYYAPHDRPRITRQFRRCIEQGVPFDDVFELTTATGRRIWVRAIGEPEHDADGTIVAARGAFQDITPLIEARNEAGRRNAELQGIMAAMGDGFVVLDREGRFVFINDKGCDYLARSRGDLIGRTFWEAFPQTRGSAFERHYEAAVERGTSQSFEGLSPVIGRYFETRMHPTPMGLAVFFRDVTDECARKERLTLLETAVDRVNDMILITEADSLEGPEHPRIVYANRAFTETTGFSAAEAVGRTPRIVQGPETQRAALDRIREGLAAGRAVRTELVNYTRAGAGYWVELDIAPITDANGRPTHFVAVQRDVTSRKQAELELRESEERLRLISEASHDIIWDWRLDTGTFWVSETLQELRGTHGGTAPGDLRALLADVHPDDAPRVRADLEAALAGSGGAWQAEFRLCRRDGEVAHVEARGAILRDADGRARRMIGALTDVTALREMTAQLHRAEKLDTVGQLTGGVAHDFNNLLTIVLGNADMLDEAGLAPPLRQRLGAIIEAAERGAELTRSLLAFARQQPLVPRATDVDALVERSHQLFRQAVPSSIALSYALDLAPQSALVDPGQLQSAVLNLVLNAGQALGERGRIVVATATTHVDDSHGPGYLDLAPGGYATVAVTDDGPGMTPETMAQAFEPFYTTRAAGSGLGLSSVYGFAKQSGGEVEIVSRPGHGTTVRLYLPLVAPEAAAGEAAEPGEDAMPPGQGEHVLVVDDDATLRASVAAMVERLGYRVSAAADAEAALALLGPDSDVALLFTDIVMAGEMNGRELAVAALARRPVLKVLFTSGYTEQALADGGPEDARLRLLSKPYRRVDLARALRAALDG